MSEALFQHIPRCLFEPLAVIGLIGFILFLCRHWKKDKAETLLFAFALLFMLAWRIAMPINADRYALLLVPVAIYFSLFAVREIAAFIRRRVPLPGDRWLFAILLVICLVKAQSGNPEDKQFFPLIDLIKADAGEVHQTLTVASNRDVSCFLGDGFELQPLTIRRNFRYADLPDADYYLLKLTPKRLPLDADDPALTEMQTLRYADGKFIFVLMKKAH